MKTSKLHSLSLITSLGTPSLILKSVNVLQHNFKLAFTDVTPVMLIKL